MELITPSNLCPKSIDFVVSFALFLEETLRSIIIIIKINRQFRYYYLAKSIYSVVLLFRHIHLTTFLTKYKENDLSSSSVAMMSFVISCEYE